MLVMPGKCPQKQVLCPSGYLVPKAFEKEHEKKMETLLWNIYNLIDQTIEYFDLDEYYNHELEDDDTNLIIEYISCTIEDQLELDLEDRDY